jgi:hypothetical protein
MVGRGVIRPAKARALAGYAVSGMTIDELSTAWNNLRNAALGRGVVPVVSQPLADEVGTAYEEWRAHLADKSAAALLLPITPTSIVEDVWVQRYRDLVAKVNGENVAVKDVLGQTFAEKAKSDAAAFATSAGGFGKQVLVAVAGGLAVAGIVYYFTHRPVMVKVEK